jgi:predicted DsbA family dithiol-disulfide isomerase
VAPRSARADPPQRARRGGSIRGRGGPEQILRLRAIFDDQDNQRPSDIIRIAHGLGLDVEQFAKDLISAEVTGRVHDDLLDAEAMNITAVPTLFINGRRHVGPYDDVQSLLRALTAPTDIPVAE